MTPERWRAVGDLYDRALSLDSNARRELLKDADPEARSMVQRMLETEAGGHMPDQPAFRTADPLTNTISGKSMSAGTMFGPYLLGQMLGAGGMGTVYSATDTRLDRRVALKIGAARYSDRFQREARAIATLNHPHVCTLYDVGPDYLVMEFIDGSTLADEIRKGPVAPATAALYASQIAAALAEAHARGIIHRDLKPGNVMLTRHGVKVLDFGLAKILSETGLTETQAVMGTPAYMAPEQVEGREPASNTDLFALGLVYYEMLTGHLPFPGASLGRMLSSGVVLPDQVLKPSPEHAALPPAASGLIAMLLRRDAALRPSAAETADRLLSLAHPAAATSQTAQRKAFRPAYAIAALLLVCAMAAGGTLLWRRIQQQKWARDQAVPEAVKLAETRPLAAYLLLLKAKAILPEDARLSRTEEDLTVQSAIETKPAGATVEMQDYAAPGEPWYTVGAAPLPKVRIPKGYFRWRISRLGAGELIAGVRARGAMQFTVPDASSPAGMVPVPQGRFADIIEFVGLLTYALPAYDIDRYEVSNAEYQEFVDHGAYRKPEYWQEKFVNNGKDLSWAEAMELLRDRNGRPGPSTWEAGHFPPGRGDYPVSGINWYEASAYARFRGKSLPVVGQWYKASPNEFAALRVRESNFGAHGPVPVHTAGGVGLYGTVGMAGNVREWSFSADDQGRRFILGGAWGTQTYQAYFPEALPPFDRSEFNGVRCVRNRAQLAPEALKPVNRYTRDFTKVKPVSDEVFRAYQLLYGYHHEAVNARKEAPDQTASYWTREKYSIDAGFNYDRLPVYLYIPKNIRPPWQAVVFFPSARVNDLPSSENPGDLQFADYVIKSGRVLVYPIYKGMYERHGNRKPPGSIGALDRYVQNSREVSRSVDFLLSRHDIDTSRIAYLGVSQGTAEGVIYAALEDRFKAAVFLDGGFYLTNPEPAEDQVNFAPHLKTPVLMVNGHYDFTFSPERSQEPLFRMLGTPAADKRRVMFETPHDVSQRPVELSKEVLAWLDRYLGKVNE